MFAGVVNRIAVSAVALDLDGTLLDTIHDLAAAINRMLARRGLPALPKVVVRDKVGKGIANLVRQSLGASHAAAGRALPTDAECAAALAQYEEEYESLLGTETVPFPGVVEGLAALRAGGFRLACITNKATRFTGPHLEQAGISKHFDIVVSGDTLPRKKPDPLPLTHTAALFGIAPKRLLMVGDSANDAQAARAAGCPILCVPYGYNEGVPVDKIDCDGIVSSVFAVSERISMI